MFDFNGKAFCFSDINDEQPKRELYKYIKEQGGIIKGAVTPSVDYFVYAEMHLYESEAFKKAQTISSIKMINYEQLGELLKSNGVDTEKMFHIKDSLGTVQKLYHESYDLDDDEGFFNALIDAWRTLEFDLRANRKLQFYFEFAEIDYGYDNELIDKWFTSDQIEKLNKWFRVGIFEDRRPKNCQEMLRLFPTYEQLFLVLPAYKHYVDPDFEFSATFYRDKWEYNGDNRGMCAPGSYIPPTVSYFIDDDTPIGFIEMESK